VAAAAEGGYKRHQPSTVLCYVAVTLRRFEQGFMNERTATAALCAAAEAGETELVKRLLDNRADSNAAYDDWTPLMHAARNDHADTARTLMVYGADPNARDLDGTTALMLAARYNLNRVACTLLSYSACPNVTSASGSTALTFAASSFFYNRSDDSMTLLLLHYRADPNATAADGRGYGASLDLDFKNITPLMHAARFGRLDVARALLQYGADPNRCAHCGNTALTWAASSEVADARAALALLPLGTSEASSIARLLLLHGADVDACNMKGQTALSLAVCRGDGPFVYELLRHGASARALQWDDVPHDEDFSQPTEMGSTCVTEILRGHWRHHLTSCAAMLCCRWFATMPLCPSGIRQQLQFGPPFDVCARSTFRVSHRQLFLSRGALMKQLGMLLCLESSVNNAFIAALNLQRLIVARSCNMRHVRKQLSIFYNIDQ
jgi:ankyrin repeat protein